MSAILFLRAMVPGDTRTGDLFSAAVPVPGHMRGGSFVRPYVAQRQHAAQHHPAHLYAAAQRVVDGRAVEFPDAAHALLYDVGRASLAGQDPAPATVTLLWNHFRGMAEHDPQVDRPFSNRAHVLDLARDYANPEFAEFFIHLPRGAATLISPDRIEDYWRRGITQIRGATLTKSLVQGHMRGASYVHPYVNHVMAARPDEPAAPRAPQTESPAFRAWFGASQVVDQAGRPLVVFHGTGAGDIQAFQRPEAGEGQSAHGAGIYFTTNHQAAGGTGQAETEEQIAVAASFGLVGYAFARWNKRLPQQLTDKQMKQADRMFGLKQVQMEATEDMGSRANYRAGVLAWRAGPTAFGDWLANDAPRWFRAKMKVQPERTNLPAVYPVFLSIQNPFDMRAPVTEEDVARVAAVIPDKRRAAFLADWTDAAATDARNGRTVTMRDLHGTLRMTAGEMSRLESSGAAVTRLLEQAGYDGVVVRNDPIRNNLGQHDVWVAFRPEQIKSAVGNSGAFDPTSPDMTKAL